MVKWAIFGAGNISNTFARNIKQVENAKNCSSSFER